MAEPDDDLEYQWIAAPDESQSRDERRSGGGSLLAAAMLAIGEIIEPEKTRVVIEQADDDPVDDLPFNIDFGDLPPLN